MLSSIIKYCQVTWILSNVFEYLPVLTSIVKLCKMFSIPNICYSKSSLQYASFCKRPSHPLIKINESLSCYGELLQKKLCSSFAFERILHLEDSLALLHLKCLLAVLHLKYLGSIFQVRQRSPLVVSLLCRNTFIQAIITTDFFLFSFCRNAEISLFRTMLNSASSV